MRDETQKRVRDWITSLPELTGKSLTRIAEEADLAVTTLTKPARNAAHPHVMSTVTIAKIVETHGVPPPRGFEHLGARGFGEREAEPFRYDAGDDFNALIKATIAGRPGIDPWLLRTPALTGFGYMPGDVVILDLSADWRAGDIVCAQLYSHAAERTETIWRRYEPPYLVAGSSDIRFVKPIHEDAVGRKGAVLLSFRPRGSEEG